MSKRATARRIGAVSAVLILISSALSIWGAVQPTASHLFGPYGWVTDAIFAVGLVMMAVSTVMFVRLGHNHEG